MESDAEFKWEKREIQALIEVQGPDWQPTTTGIL